MTIDLDVSLAAGDAVVTVRITAWPTRPRWGYAGGDPGDPGEWEVVEVVVPCERCDGSGEEPGRACIACCGGEYAIDPDELTDDDQRRIDDAVQEWMADNEEDER